MFTLVDDWLDTLPGKPMRADLRVEESIYSAYDPSWKVPIKIRNDQYGYCGNISWPAYLYKVIMKYNAALKQNAELRKAFHRLVRTLHPYNHKSVTYVDYDTAMKNYDYVLMPPSEKEPWLALPAPFYYQYNNNYIPIHISQIKVLGPQFYEAYKRLYDLMEKHGILAWIRTCREEKKTAIQLEINTLQEKLSTL